MTATRDQIVDAASGLFETQGYHATGLSQILRASGAPKGSLYYYFPDGKEGLAAEAIARAGQRVAERIQANLAGEPDPAAAIGAFVRRIAQAVEDSGFRAGGPLQSVALETANRSERLNLACRAAYDALQGAFAAKLLAGGFGAEQAAALAGFITAAVEGAILLSRTYHTGDPLRSTARQLESLIASALR